jgi:hypothetical protein
MLMCVCLRILASSRIPQYDLGRQTPHFRGGSVTVIIGLISHTSLKIILLQQQEFKLLHTKLIQIGMLIQELHITSPLILIS